MPKRLVAIWCAVAALLRDPQRAGDLYGAGDIARELNNAADVHGNKNITKCVDLELLLRAFAHDAVDEYILRYDEHFLSPGDKNVLYVKKLGRSGRYSAGGKSSIVLDDSVHWRRRAAQILFVGTLRSTTRPATG